MQGASPEKVAHSEHDMPRCRASRNRQPNSEPGEKPRHVRDPESSDQALPSTTLWRVLPVGNQAFVVLVGSYRWTDRRWTVPESSRVYSAVPLANRRPLPSFRAGFQAPRRSETFKTTGRPVAFS